MKVKMSIPLLGSTYMMLLFDALSDMVSFVQFKKRERFPWRSVTFSKVLLLVKLQAKACNFTKSNTPPWVFFTFLKYKWI